MANKIAQGQVKKDQSFQDSPADSASLLTRLARAIVLIILIAIAMFPVFWIISLSLRPNSETLGRHPTFLPVKWTLENYLQVFGIEVDTERTQTLPFEALMNYISNGAFVAIMVTLIAGILSILAGYSFSRFEFPGKRFLLISILNTQMFPYIAIIIPIYLVYRDLGLINTYSGLIIAELGLVLPFSIWMMKGFCDTIDRDLEDAAFVEGASRLRVIWSIIVPLIVPGVAAVSMFSFLASWNHMMYVMLLSTDESIMTVPLGILTRYGGSFQYTYGLLAAGIVTTTLPVVILFLWLQKYFISGITAGAVKG
jgi:multiple sugar transport system permease protein